MCVCDITSSVGLSQDCYCRVIHFSCSIFLFAINFLLTILISALCANNLNVFFLFNRTSNVLVHLDMSTDTLATAKI